MENIGEGRPGNATIQGATEGKCRTVCLNEVLIAGLLVWKAEETHGAPDGGGIIRCVIKIGAGHAAEKYEMKGSSGVTNRIMIDKLSWLVHSFRQIVVDELCFVNRKILLLCCCCCFLVTAR